MALQEYTLEHSGRRLASRPAVVLSVFEMGCDFVLQLSSVTVDTPEKAPKCNTARKRIASGPRLTWKLGLETPMLDGCKVAKCSRRRVNWWTPRPLENVRFAPSGHPGVSTARDLAPLIRYPQPRAAGTHRRAHAWINRDATHFHFSQGHQKTVESFTKRQVAGPVRRPPDLVRSSLSNHLSTSSFGSISVAVL